jgi:hypothetical protein
METVLIEQAKAAGIFDHPDNIGAARECFVNNFLKSITPPRTQIWTGEIIDHTVTPSSQERRKQVDLAISRDDVPVLTFDEHTALMPCEAVLATIEVKSQLNKQHMFRALDAIQAWRQLTRPPFQGIYAGYMPDRILNFIFAFNAPAFETISGYMREYSRQNGLPLENLFDVCTILNKGTIATNTGITVNQIADNRKYVFIEQQQDNLFAFLYAIYINTGLFLSTPPNLIEYFRNRPLNQTRTAGLFE